MTESAGTPDSGEAGDDLISRRRRKLDGKPSSFQPRRVCGGPNSLASASPTSTTSVLAGAPSGSQASCQSIPRFVVQTSRASPTSSPCQLGGGFKVPEMALRPPRFPCRERPRNGLDFPCHGSTEQSGPCLGKDDTGGLPQPPGALGGPLATEQEQPGTDQGGAKQGVDTLLTVARS